MRQKAIERIEKRHVRSDIPILRPGDTVRVHSRIIEGDKERIQVFEGVVLRVNGGSHRATFTVRKVSYGIGVERIFPLHSPRIEKIEVASSGRVRRARLYYLRDRTGKSARLKGVAIGERARKVLAVDEPPAAEAAAPPEDAAAAAEEEAGQGG